MVLRCVSGRVGGWGVAAVGRGVLAVAVTVGGVAAGAQDVAKPQQGVVQRGRAPEAAIDGFARLNDDRLELKLPGGGASLQLGDLEFEGDPVGTGKLHLRQLAEGVYEITSVAYTVGDWRFRVFDSSSYYGLGERFNALNHTHSIVRNLSADNASAKGSSTYKPMPFFMSTRGYGLWVDTTADATFDMNASSGTDVVVDVPAEKLRLVLFTGPEFTKILERLTAQAGRSMLPPYWAFAPWISRDFHKDQAEVLADVEHARTLGIPASVLMIDSPWTTAYNDYTFNPKQFNDAAAMVKTIHQQGYKLVLWHTSWINSKSDVPHETGFADRMQPKAANYDEAASNGYFVRGLDGSPYVGRWWKGEGSLIDFTNPRAKLWWQDQVRKAISAGADGFKDDDAEGSFVTGPVKFADGTDPRLMRNRYAVLYNNAMEELVQKDLKGNGVLFCRSVTQGANGLGLLWGGDNEASFSPENGLPTVVRAGLGAGMSGMPLWTADLGGYEATATTPDPVLFQRWTEYAAFSPTMEVVSSKNVGPWDYGDQALATFKKYSILHMSLFPYRYAAVQQAAKTGLPIMRALALDYQDDAQARERSDEYLFGPDLLVAPVVTAGTQRTVYLPKGDWVDYWTGAPQQGGREIVVDAAYDQIPVYARAGAVLAKIPEDVMTLVPAAESGNAQLHALDARRVYEVVGAAGTANFTDFEGRSVERSGSMLKIAGEKTAHAIVRFRSLHPKSVTVNGAAAKLGEANGEAFVEFDLAKTATVSWQ